MRLFLILSFTLISSVVFSQKKCDCERNMNLIANQIEENSASYAHQVVENKKHRDYQKHKKQIFKLAKGVKTEKECLGIVQLYLSFLRDTHQKLHITNDFYPFKTFDDTISVKKFIQENVENHQLKKMTPKGILGDWHHKNGLFSIQIQKNDKKGRKYIGVLTSDVKVNKQFLGYKGDVKVEFYSNYKGELVSVYWDFGQKPSVHKVEYDGKTLKLGRNFIFYKNKQNISKTDQYKLQDSIFFKELSPRTNYFRIHSFDYENKPLIDSIIGANKEKLISKENLIIDVRNNDGGSTLSYHKLLPFILDKKEYQSPIVATSIWVSKENFQDYSNERYLYGVKTKQDSLNADKRIEELGKYIGRFEPYEKKMSKIDSYHTNPKKVYIIQNKWDASAAEGFILVAKQSGKVKTFGENTAGMVSYGEWRKLLIPNFPAWISLTQKRMIFYNDSDFESIGLSPDQQLNPDSEKEWINIVQEEIEKN